MQIQTQTEVVRGVCFSAAKHNDFKSSVSGQAQSKSRNLTMIQQQVQRVDWWALETKWNHYSPLNQSQSQQLSAYHPLPKYLLQEKNANTINGPYE